MCSERRRATASLYVWLCVLLSDKTCGCVQKEEERLRASIRRDNQKRRLKERAEHRGINSSYLEGGYEDEDEEDDGLTSISAIKRNYKEKRDSECLLLLRFQLDLWGSPFLERFFAYVTVFNPTIEVVTFCLQGWCMLGVVLLPAFTCLGQGVNVRIF